MLFLIESSFSSASVKRLHTWRPTQCIQAGHKKKPRKGKAVFHLPVRLNFPLFFAAYFSATWLPYKLFQVVLMELFWFELLAPGFICLFSLPGVQWGRFPIRRVWSPRSTSEQVILRLVWVLAAPQMYEVLDSAGTVYRQQRLQSHQRKKLLPKISVLMQRSRVLGYTPPFMGSLSLSWCFFLIFWLIRWEFISISSHNHAEWKRRHVRSEKMLQGQ